MRDIFPSLAIVEDRLAVGTYDIANVIKVSDSKSPKIASQQILCALLSCC